MRSLPAFARRQQNEIYKLLRAMLTALIYLSGGSGCGAV